MLALQPWRRTNMLPGADGDDEAGGHGKAFGSGWEKSACHAGSMNGRSNAV